MKRVVLRDGILVALMALLSLWLVPAAATGQAPSGQDSGGQTKVSDEELSAFAKAYVEFHKIRQRYETSLRETKEPAEQERIRREGNAKLKETVEKQGLTMETYNRIFTTVNGNEELRKKALKLIDEERKKS